MTVTLSLPRACTDTDMFHSTQGMGKGGSRPLTIKSGSALLLAASGRHGGTEGMCKGTLAQAVRAPS
eukprot:4023421-Amphidinium_carterae.1